MKEIIERITFPIVALFATIGVCLVIKSKTMNENNG